MEKETEVPETEEWINQIIIHNLLIEDGEEYDINKSNWAFYYYY